MKAVLFKSDERYDAFYRKLREKGVDVTTLDIANQDWVSFDYTKIGIVI